MVYFRFVVRWMMKILLWGGIAYMGWMVFSCKEFCEEQNRTAVVVNFYDSSDVVITVKDSIKGIENDSLLYPNIYSGTSLKQVMLPINPSADIMSFSFKKDTFPADTVIIRYSRRNGFISPECGCVTFAEIEDEPERTENTITRVVVTNPKVTTVSYRKEVINAENIRIYY